MPSAAPRKGVSVNPEFLILFVWLFLASFAILGRLLIGILNHARINAHLRERGCRTIWIRWAPFGPGWFGGRASQLYHVRYQTPQREVYECYVKTGWFASVYFRDERHIPAENAGPMTYGAPPSRNRTPKTATELLEEERLRRERIRQRRKQETGEL